MYIKIFLSGENCIGNIDWKPLAHALYLESQEKVRNYIDWEKKVAQKRTEERCIYDAFCHFN